MLKRLARYKHLSLLQFFYNLGPSFKKIWVNFFCRNLFEHFVCVVSALYVRLLEHNFLQKNNDEKDEWTRITKTKVLVGNRNC
jgi:hypothetical protein